MKINRYTEFINEYYSKKVRRDNTRAVELTEEEFLTTLNENCKNFDAYKSIYLWRGAKYDGDYLYIDPTMFNRRAIDKIDIHSFLFDNLPSWSGYPKRSKNIITSTDANEAKPFGDELYMVIPFDDVPIVISPEKDVWKTIINNDIIKNYNKAHSNLSFGTYITNPNSFFGALNSFISMAGLEVSMTDGYEYTTDYETFVYFFENVFDVDKLPPYHPILELIKFTFKLNDNKDITGELVLKFIKMVFDPEFNKFKLTKYDSNFKIDNIREPKSVWVGGKSLLIKESLFLKLKTKIT